MPTKVQQREQQEAIQQLRDWIKPGDTVYTILDHVSSSGMSRAIRVVVPEIVSKNFGQTDPHLPSTGYVAEFRHPNYAIGKALGLRHWKRNGREQDALVMGGCGMDMGFHLVYTLSSVLYGKGYPCLGKGKCPSNYHSNHRDTIRCEHCQWIRGSGWLETDGDGELVQPPRECTYCTGTGSLANPAGPERWDLVHTDEYALRHRWL